MAGKLVNFVKLGLELVNLDKLGLGTSSTLTN